MAMTGYSLTAASRSEPRLFPTRPHRHLLPLFLTVLFLLVLALPGRTDTLTSLFSFQGPADGNNSWAALYQGRDGNRQVSPDPGHF